MEPQTSMREEMIALSESLSGSIGCSRLEATAVALRFAVKGMDEWPLLMGKLAPEAVPGEDCYPEAPVILRAAWDLADYGFTLDDLIAAVGPDMVIRPKAYKNQLSRLLKGNGFFRKQIRRNDSRPLAWFHPKRCGIMD